ncbi:hypothetical protein [Nocardioides sp. Leaf285]|uniref:hypothetical protein n=1 Tax=Nocardioides sp. Leaf285 TaxID=1736322 RepID=UPI000702DE9A|nr:hypothetical protein [Nocardioides sp. Leaf285]KQP62961.1 hypothetical protein ASF47_18285 [Nocardioides sp. Leaf285]
MTFEPSHTSPAKIVDAQIDLHSRFADKDFQASFLGLVSWTMVAPDLPDEQVSATIAEVMYGRSGERLVASLTSALDQAPAYRISPDMVALALHTSDTLDESDIVDLDMAPSESGFVRLEVPLPSVREDGRVTPVTWLVWHPTEDPDFGRATTCFMFHDLFEHDLPWLREEEMGPQTYDQWRAKVGRWHPEWRTGLRHGDTVGPARYSYTARDLAPDPIRHISPGLISVLIGDAASYADLNPARFLYGLWMLMAQPVTSVEPEVADRPARRRASRSDLTGPTSEGAVRLIALRREKVKRAATGPDPVDDDQDWDDTDEGRRSKVRWITRQHWRWQPYGPRKGVEHEHQFSDARASEGIMTSRCVLPADPDVVAAGRDDGTGRCAATVKRILIDAYVKGPQGAPLRFSKKVYDVT